VIGLQSPVLPADSLRTIIDAVVSAPAYQTRAPVDPWAPVRRLWWSLLDWIMELRGTSPTAYRLLVWGMVLILAAIVTHALWIAARTIRAGTGPADRRDATPPPAPRDAAWYGAHAERLAAEGRFAEAMQSDFLRLVLELDARSVMRFHPSKTPGEYVREGTMTPDARRNFRQLVVTLYTHAFARVAATEALWVRWRDEATADRYAGAH
jgi:hypothetical protein